MKSYFTKTVGPASLSLLFLLTIATGLLAEVKATETAKAVNLNNISYLAETGQYDAMLQLLQASEKTHPNPQVHALVEQIQQMQEHARRQTEQRRKDHGEALKKMQEHVQSKDLVRALVQAVEAYRLADDAEAFLKQDQIVTLAGEALKTAHSAERQGDWLQALSLYSTLERLYKSSTQYADSTKRSRRHVRLLRMYAPKELARLFAQRNKNNPAKANNFNEEGWDVMVEGVKLRMLEDALDQAANYHIAQNGYLPLMQGAIDAMLEFTNNKALAETFVALKNVRNVATFRTQLIELKHSLKKIGDQMTQRQARDAVSAIMAANGQTLQLPDEVLIYELADGAMDVLDQFSVMIWPREVQQWQRHILGSFVGVGIQIRMNDQLKLQVVSPLPGTPAFKAGVRPNDLIVKVNAEDTAGWTLDKAVRQITGIEGTEVVIGVQRKDVKDVIDFTIKRTKIKIESVKGWQPRDNGQWNYFVDQKSRIGYVRISSFMPQTAGDLDKAINQMQQNGPINGLILDLRANPGGLLRSAIDVSDRFIEQGNLLSIVGPNGRRTKEYPANRRNTHSNFPMLVLVNERSASASEIVSGALRDFGRALIVGVRSYGKGSVQNLYDLPRFGLKPAKARLKLTTEYYMLPKGDLIHRKPGAKEWGIEPDLSVSITDKLAIESLEFRSSVDVFGPAAQGQEKPTADQILQKGLDPQLAAAVLVLKARQLARKLAVAK